MSGRQCPRRDGGQFYGSVVATLLYSSPNPSVPLHPPRGVSDFMTPAGQVTGK